MSIRSKVIGLVIAALVGMMFLSAAALYIERDLLLEDRMVKTRHVVESTYGVLQHFQALQASGALPEAEAKAQAISTIRRLRYDDKEYFWINDMQPQVVLHPIKPELEGKDASTIKDPNGTALFVEFVTTARKSGAGFVAYLWPKPGSEQPQPKISYVKHFQPWDWVLGSGIYVDDVNRIFREEAAKLGLVVLSGLLVLGSMAFLLARSILRPMMDMESAIQHIQSNNDLTERVQIHHHDELGRIGTAFNRMIASFQETVQQVTDSSHQVSSASIQLSGMVQHMNERANKQNDAAAAMATVVEELTASIENIASSASDAQHIAQQSGQLSGQGAMVVENAVDEMRKIANSVDRSASFIEDLGRHSGQISAIAQTIKEIADQTNLLALNAAIEAARAGEHGRGFAVVADEVRKLAERTTQSTSEISAMVASIQTETSNAVASMAEGSAFVRDGVELASQAGESMQQIRNEASRVEIAVNDITHALREQNAASDHVASSSTQIAEMIHETCQEANSVADASRHLAEQAGRLQSAVARFRV
jgi:methyl-accepting chemotaxis protein